MAAPEIRDNMLLPFPCACETILLHHPTKPKGKAMNARRTSPYMVTHIPVLSESAMDYRYAVWTNGERMLVVCTEGVSWEVTDDKPWKVAGIECTRDGIDSMIAKDLGAQVTVSLDRWIRSFGSRLESNFHQAEWWIRVADCDICQNSGGHLLCDAHR